MERIRLTCHLSIFDKTGITEGFSSQLSNLKNNFHELDRERESLLVVPVAEPEEWPTVNLQSRPITAGFGSYLILKLMEKLSTLNTIHLLRTKKDLEKSLILSPVTVLRGTARWNSPRFLLISEVAN